MQIVAEEDHSDDSYSVTYFPVVEYEAGGKTVSKKSSFGQNPSKYNVGDKVDVCYNPEKVEEYIIKGDTSSTFIGVIFIILGVIIAIVGVFNIIKGN